MARYRFMLPDGQTYESTETPEQILARYPEARITHSVETSGVTGESTLQPYDGETALDPEAAVVPDEAPSGDEGADSGTDAKSKKKGG